MIPEFVSFSVEDAYEGISRHKCVLPLPFLPGETCCPEDTNSDACVLFVGGIASPLYTMGLCSRPWECVLSSCRAWTEAYVCTYVHMSDACF